VKDTRGLIEAIMEAVSTCVPSGDRLTDELGVSRDDCVAKVSDAVGENEREVENVSCDGLVLAVYDCTDDVAEGDGLSVTPGENVLTKDSLG
jgi:hypothetical protein